MNGPRVIVYGMGRIGCRIARYAMDKGAQVVAGYVRSAESRDAIARDFPGLELCLPDRPLDSHRADILLIAHSGLYCEMFDVARRGALAGLDVITLSDEGFDPFMLSENMEASQILHHLFVKAGRTMLSVGVQDALWYAQPLGLAMGAQRIIEMRCTCISDRGLFGHAASADLPLGLTPAQFRTAGLASGQAQPGVLAIGLRPLIHALDLSIRHCDLRNEPLIAEQDFSLPDGRQITAGMTCGIVEHVTYHTEEGPRIGGQFSKGYFPAGTATYNEWVLHGEPDLSLRIDGLRGDVMVAATVVNRMLDVIKAAPGMARVDQIAPGRHVSRLRHVTHLAAS